MPCHVFVSYFVLEITVMILLASIKDESYTEDLIKSDVVFQRWILHDKFYFTIVERTHNGVLLTKNLSKLDKLFTRMFWNFRHTFMINKY